MSDQPCQQSCPQFLDVRGAGGRGWLLKPPLWTGGHREPPDHEEQLWKLKQWVALRAPLKVPALVLKGKQLPNARRIHRL